MNGTIPMEEESAAAAKPRAKRAVKAKAEPKPRKSRAKPKPKADPESETLPEDGNVEMPELTRELSATQFFVKLDPPSKAPVMPRGLATDADALELSPVWTKFKADVATGKYTPVATKSGKPNLGKLAVQVSKMLTANAGFRPLVGAMLRDSPYAELCPVFGM